MYCTVCTNGKLQKYSEKIKKEKKSYDSRTVCCIVVDYQIEYTGMLVKVKKNQSL